MAGKPRIAPKFSRHLFSKDLSINNVDLRDILNKNKMHGNINVIQNYDKIKENKDAYVPGFKHECKKQPRKLINSYPKYDLETTTTTIFEFSFFLKLTHFRKAGELSSLH